MTGPSRQRGTGWLASTPQPQQDAAPGRWSTGSGPPRWAGQKVPRLAIAFEDLPLTWQPGGLGTGA